MFLLLCSDFQNKMHMHHQYLGLWVLIAQRQRTLRIQQAHLQVPISFYYNCRYWPLYLGFTECEDEDEMKSSTLCTQRMFIIDFKEFFPAYCSTPLSSFWFVTIILSGSSLLFKSEHCLSCCNSVVSQKHSNVLQSFSFK